MRAFLARSQHNSPILYIRVQWIAWADIEAAAKRPRKNDLSLCGNFGLHGKTILPCFLSLGNHESVCDWRRFRLVGRSSVWPGKTLAVPRPPADGPGSRVRMEEEVKS